jgi:hypothetical protein
MLRSFGAAMALFVSLAVMMAIIVAPASASIVHKREATFNGSEAPGGAFAGLLVSDAVEQATGDVYVTEWNPFGTGSNVVDKFTAAGVYANVQITGSTTPQGALGLSFNSGTAVDSSAGVNKGDVYVADSEHGMVDRFSAAGVFLCQISGEEQPSPKECAVGGSGLAGSVTPSGLAVDPSGDIYVADVGHEDIDKFSASGTYLATIQDSHLAEGMRTMAMNSSGDLYVTLNNHVAEFDASGTLVALIAQQGANVGASPTMPTSVGVDPSTNHVYVAESGLERIGEYDSAGAIVSTIPALGLNLSGLSVDGASGKIYATEFGEPRATGFSTIIYSGDIAVPTVVVGAVTAASETEATLTATVDPDVAHGGVEITSCYFEYGTSKEYGTTVPCSPGPPFVAPVDVGAAIKGLHPGVTYHFRLLATSTNGTEQSEDATFTTAGAPVIETVGEAISGGNATLHATIDPSRLPTSCRLQYVEDATFQSSGYAGASSVPCDSAELAADGGPRVVRATIHGAVDTIYHYRFLAENGAGATGSADRTLTTYGARSAHFELLGREGHPYTQAGGDPYELRTAFEVNSFQHGPGEKGAPEGPDGNLKDLLTVLPAGLIGSPAATPRCTRQELSLSLCKGAAQVGELIVELEGEEDSVAAYGIYNLVPPKGVAAEFGANVLHEVNVYIDSKVRTGGDYGVVAESTNVGPLAAVKSASVDLWGVPADPSHDAERICPGQTTSMHGCSAKENPAEELTLKPFLRNPTSCVGPLTTTISLDSWQSAGQFSSTDVPMPAITGCNEVPFSPTLKVEPTTSVADTPTGLNVDLHIPQNESPEGIAEGDLRNTTVALPPGVSTNPAAAGGLGGCSPGQIGLTSSPGVTPVTMTPDAASCPDAAKIGTVEVDTPLLDHPLRGAVYIATPFQNPFNSLLAIYVAIDDPETGIVVKLAGQIAANPQTGQLTTTFSDSPQVPFEDFKLDFFDGPRAALATPDNCGTYSTSSSLTPWSGTAAVGLSEPFQVSSGCVSGFAPSFNAGTASPQAGAYSPFTLSFSRTDSEEGLAGASVSLPQGLIGKIAGVSECSDAQIAAAAGNSGGAEVASPSCPAASQIGTVQTGSGAGPDPLLVAGKAYLTGPYKGAPYGIAVVVPALAGPYDLGTVVIRQALHIDPADAHVTDISDPFPTILQGIPLRLKSVSVTLDRPDFTFNPTSCEPKTITATLESTGGAHAGVSSHYQAANCAALKFAPKFTASTAGKASKAKGASLDVKVGYPTGPQGTYANIKSVKVDLPKQLPSRLTTLQEACVAATFEKNPADCPVASNVGTAVATTPVLNVPFTGPAYLVSHGGEAFPDLEIILQGEGVTLVLVGNTQIKNGITSSTFKTVPDAPVSSFELKLPAGPDSILSANVPQSAKYNLCGQALQMPTEITAQNGALINQTTKIAITGCAKKKTLTRAQKLAAALKACHRDRRRAKRQKCETEARARYGSARRKVARKK